jgi:serine/threonine-protein kinase
VRDLALRCLSKDPRDRPSARQAAIVLAAAAGIRPPLGEEGPESLAAFPSPVGRRRRYVTLGGAGAVAAAVAAVAAVTLSGGDRSAPAQAGTSPNSMLTVTVGGGIGPGSHSPSRRPLGPSANLANTWSNNVLPIGSSTPDISTSVDATQPATTPTPMPTPTPTPPPPRQQTLTSTGGSMDVTCTGSEVYLVSWTANSGFRVQGFERGPGSSVWVVFRRKQIDYTMTVACQDGVAVAKESRHDTGGGAGSN